MSRRIDIELTSTRDDGTWTWRAAGAKQPKGSLDGSLLAAGASVGDQLRAEVETSLDGTDVLAVLPPKTKNRAAVETIELTARPLGDDELVIETRAPRGRGGRDRGDRGDRRERGDRKGGREGRGGPREGRGGRPDRGPRGDGPGGDRPQGEHSGPGGRSAGGGRSGGGDRPDRGGRERPAPPAKPKAKRLRAGRVHRKAALDLLAPEEQVIAEQVLRGGVPAVRQAVDKMNEQAKAEGRPEVKAEPLVAVAERLLPALRTAEWRDKAEAAIAEVAELDLRDLRSVVVAAESSAKDDETRALAAQLRDGLAARVDHEQATWLAEIAETLADGRIVRALRLSSRPPKAGAPLPVDMAAKLAEGASAALTDDTMVDRWATVLDALSFSPVRLTAAPASKPAEPSDELIAAVTRVAARVPKVAEAFGIEAAPESGRKRPRGAKSAGRPKRGPKAGGPGGSAPIPPPPPMPTAIDEVAPAQRGPATPPAPEVPPELDVASATTDPEPTASSAPAGAVAEPVTDGPSDTGETPEPITAPDSSPAAEPVVSAPAEADDTSSADSSA